MAMNNQYNPNGQNNQQYQQYNYQAPQNNNYYQPGQNYNPVEEPSKGEGIKAMIFGILSIYIGWFTPLPFVGLIFAILAKKWALPIVENYPQSAAAKFAKIGKITGTIGIPLSIVATCIIALVIIVYILYFFIIGAILSSGGMYY